MKKIAHPTFWRPQNFYSAMGARLLTRDNALPRSLFTDTEFRQLFDNLLGALDYFSPTSALQSDKIPRQQCCNISLFWLTVECRGNVAGVSL
ncbi:MAG TPA: hypothetical protein PKY63_11460 [Bacteroidales bacterium]|nr:hypothetical protein [Bacteroidales bacterium]